MGEGHGIGLRDQDGDEADGQDEGYCTVGPNWEWDPYEQWALRDDDFANALTQFVPATCRILVLSDSCHSGTMCDFDKPQWYGRKACSISGCQDHQEAASYNNRGGVFSNSIFLAVDDLQYAGKRGFSCAYMYNAMLQVQKTVFANYYGCGQIITAQVPAGCGFNFLPWPLVPLPQYRYTAPLRQCFQRDGQSTDQQLVPDWMIQTIDPQALFDGGELSQDDDVDEESDD